MLVMLEGIVIDDNKVAAPMSNIQYPMIVSPLDKTTWVREEQYRNVYLPNG